MGYLKMRQYIWLFLFFVALSVLDGCATTQYISPENSLVINEIKTRGTGQRLVISDWQPREDGITATYEVFESPTGAAVISAPYGGDVKMGNGSILSFKGKIYLNGITFRGDDIDPLVFTVLDNVGLVYVRGKGSVILKDGREAFLP